MIRKFPRILFFINGPLPTEEQQNEALEYGFNVAFRNADLISADGCREECDGVAGEVPERYADKPHADEALAAWSRKLRGIEDTPDDGATGDGGKAPKGKGKGQEEKPAVGDSPKQLAAEKTPEAPADPPAWVPNS